jgi:hypothetical protein
MVVSRTLKAGTVVLMVRLPGPFLLPLRTPTLPTLFHGEENLQFNMPRMSDALYRHHKRGKLLIVNRAIKEVGE